MRKPYALDRRIAKKKLKDEKKEWNLHICTCGSRIYEIKRIIDYEQSVRPSLVFRAKKEKHFLVSPIFFACQCFFVSPFVAWKRITFSPAGIRTPVSRVTSGDTHHYTFFFVFLAFPRAECNALGSELQGGVYLQGSKTTGRKGTPWRGGTLTEAGPPNSPGSRTPPHQEFKKRKTPQLNSAYDRDVCARV